MIRPKTLASNSSSSSSSDGSKSLNSIRSSISDESSENESVSNSSSSTSDASNVTRGSDSSEENESLGNKRLEEENQKGLKCAVYNKDVNSEIASSRGRSGARVYCTGVCNCSSQIDLTTATASTNTKSHSDESASVSSSSSCLSCTDSSCSCSYCRHCSSSWNSSGCSERSLTSGCCGEQGSTTEATDTSNRLNSSCSLAANSISRCPVKRLPVKYICDQRRHRKSPMIDPCERQASIECMMPTCWLTYSHGWELSAYRCVLERRSLSVDNVDYYCKEVRTEELLAPQVPTFCLPQEPEGHLSDGEQTREERLLGSCERDLLLAPDLNSSQSAASNEQDEEQEQLKRSASSDCYKKVSTAPALSLFSHNSNSNSNLNSTSIPRTTNYSSSQSSAGQAATQMRAGYSAQLTLSATVDHSQRHDRSLPLLSAEKIATPTRVAQQPSAPASPGACSPVHTSQLHAFYLHEFVLSSSLSVGRKEGGSLLATTSDEQLQLADDDEDELANDLAEFGMKLNCAHCLCRHQILMLVRNEQILNRLALKIKREDKQQSVLVTQPLESDLVAATWQQQQLTASNGEQKQIVSGSVDECEEDDEDDQAEEDEEDEGDMADDNEDGDVEEEQDDDDNDGNSDEDEDEVDNEDVVNDDLDEDEDDEELDASRLMNVENEEIELRSANNKRKVKLQQQREYELDDDEEDDDEEEEEEEEEERSSSGASSRLSQEEQISMTLSTSKLAPPASSSVISRLGVSPTFGPSSDWSVTGKQDVTAPTSEPTVIETSTVLLNENPVSKLTDSIRRQRRPAISGASATSQDEYEWVSRSSSNPPTPISALGKHQTDKFSSSSIQSRNSVSSYYFAAQSRLNSTAQQVAPVLSKKSSISSAQPQAFQNFYKQHFNKQKQSIRSNEQLPIHKMPASSLRISTRRPLEVGSPQAIRSNWQSSSANGDTNWPPELRRRCALPGQPADLSLVLALVGMDAERLSVDKQDFLR